MGLDSVFQTQGKLINIGNIKMSEEYKLGYRDGFKDGFEQGQKQPNVVKPVDLAPLFKPKNDACKVCNRSGLDHYVCSRADCPGIFLTMV